MSGRSCKDVTIVAWDWLCLESEPERVVHRHLRGIINISSRSIKTSITLQLSNFDIRNWDFFGLDLIPILCYSEVNLIIDIPVVITRRLSSKDNSYYTALSCSRSINNMLAFANSLTSSLGRCLGWVNFENNLNKPIKRKSVEDRGWDASWRLNAWAAGRAALEISKDPLVFNWEACVAFNGWVLVVCECLLGSSERDARNIAGALDRSELKHIIILGRNHCSVNSDYSLDSLVYVQV